MEDNTKERGLSCEHSFRDNTATLVAFNDWIRNGWMQETVYFQNSKGR